MAILDGEPIRLGDAQAPVALQIYKLQMDIHRLIREQSREIADRRLFGREAERLGISVDELQHRIEASVPSATDAEIEAYLIEHPTITSSPALRTRVATYLNQRRVIEARLDFVERLRRRSEFVFLVSPPAPPRVNQDLASTPVRGPSSAPVTIVHFGDFHSPRSARTSEYLTALHSLFPGRIRQAHRPLVREPDEVALRSALLGFAAEEAGRFWDYHDRLFALGGDYDAAALGRLAEELDLAGTLAELEQRYLPRLQRELEQATEQGLPRSSVLLVNGRYFNPTFPFETLRDLVAEELERAAARVGVDD